MKMKSKLTQLALSLALALAAGSATAAADSAQPLGAGPDAAPSHAAKFTPAQLAEIQARVDLANTIVKNVEADAAAKGATDTWRMGLLSSLYNTPSASLHNIAASATTVDQAHALASTARAQAQQSSGSQAKDLLGGSASGLVYTPKTPCRFIDTRNVGGAITSTPRLFDTEFFNGEYGGTVGCTLPSIGQPGFVANVTIVVPPGPAGFIGIRPRGNTVVTSFINWESTGTTGLANAGVITTALVSGNYWFEVFEGGGNSPQFILDYFGYFSVAQESALALDCIDTASATHSVAAGQTTFFDTPACPSGYTAVSAYCFAGTSTVQSDGQGWFFCAWTNFGGSAQNITEQSHCCRTPGF
jgi:hypothetical protein